MTTVERYHDISVGHRVYGHESKCSNLHGHNYRITFTITAEKLDSIGRVIDFSIIKTKLCQWLEDNFDHRFLLWNEDPIAPKLIAIDDTVVLVPFNPTAENIAEYLTDIVSPTLLRLTGTRVVACKVEETRKCSATYFPQ